jgi:transcriptional regulator with XRE-family HTH domain
MAKRGDPAVLRQVVIFLRSHAQMTQAQLGKAARVDQAEISRYELGYLAPSDEALRRIARVARIDWPLVVHLRQFFASLLAWEARQAEAHAGEALDLAILEPALLAVAPYRIETRTSALPRLPDEESREAAQIWEALEKHPISLRRRLIELSPRSGSWALALQACEASLKSAVHDAAEALELAELALSIAERVARGESWRLRVEGYCWAYIGNARRVANDLAGADQAFVRAWDLWRLGVGSGPEMLAEWRLLSLEASLRRDQLRFPEALKLLDQAREAGREDQRATARILLKMGNVLEQLGDSESALAALRDAAPFVAASGDARLALCLRFDTANNLCLLSRYAEAAELLPQVREWATQQANDLDLIRLVWLESRVAAGQGRAEEAIAGLEEVRAYFTGHELAYDAALSSLELAVIWLHDGRTAEVRELAIEMEAIFRAKKIHREALAALVLFWEAAKRETATVELVRQVIAEMEKAKRLAPSERPR